MDYRYFPEPDLPPLAVEPAEVAAARAALPELPEARIRRYRAETGLSGDEVLTLVQSPAFADYYDAVARTSGQPRAAANWMLGDLSRVLNDRGQDLGALGLAPEALGELVRLVAEGIVGLGAAREGVFPALLAGEGTAREIVAWKGLALEVDPGAVAARVAAVLAAHPDVVAQIRGGRASLRGFLVGQVLKAGGGKLDPKAVNRALDESLAKP